MSAPDHPPMGALVRCHFCRNRAAWRYPSGWRVCSSCRQVVDAENWNELASRWLRNYPEQWVGDVASFVEAHLAQEGSRAEPDHGRGDM